MKALTPNLRTSIVTVFMTAFKIWGRASNMKQVDHNSSVHDHKCKWTIKVGDVLKGTLASDSPAEVRRSSNMHFLKQYSLSPSTDPLG